MSTNESKSNHFKMDKTIESIETDFQNWFQFIDEMTNSLNQRFDILSASIEEKNHLVEEIESKHEIQLKDIISKSNLKNINKSSIDWTENDLINESNALNTCVEGLAQELVQKRQHKTELTNQTKALTRRLEQMESTVKELKRDNNKSENTEYLTLAAVMRVMYKTWNNSKVIGLLFNDSEEKNLERLIVIDRDNKSEQQMAQQFWDSLNRDYRIDD